MSHLRWTGLLLAIWLVLVPTCAAGTATGDLIISRQKATSPACDYYGVVITVGLLARAHAATSVRAEAARRDWMLLVQKAETVESALGHSPALRVLVKPYTTLVATLESANRAIQQHAYRSYQRVLAAAVPELASLRLAERTAHLRCVQKSGSGTITIGP